jgi:hypothetical protein
MVRVSLMLRPRTPSGAQDLLDGLRSLAVSTRLEPGCVSCSAWNDPMGVRYMEEWATEADMRQRIRSDGFTSVLSIVEAAADAQVQFDFVSKTRGLDYVKEVRDGTWTDARGRRP